MSIILEEITPVYRLDWYPSPKKEGKMAVSGFIAEELFHAIRLRDYCEYVSKLNRADIMVPSEFKYSEYSSIYNLDTRICYTDQRINKNHM